MKINTFLIFLFFCLQLSCTGQQPSDQTGSTSLPMPEVRILTAADVLTGAERTGEYRPLLQDKRVGLVVNQTSTIGQTHLVDSLLNTGLDIALIFAPEHGFRGDADAGAAIEDDVDSRTGIPVVSLYGNSKKPTAEHLSQVDILVFDIQDVGVRFYTYLSTMKYVMESCAENKVPCMILDRPNPNGYYVDGPILKMEFSSFVGALPVPVVHGMTLGEMAMMIKGENWIDQAGNLDLTVIPCLGYDHRSTYELPVKPSPNLPNLQSILLYPSLCFFEPTDFSIGRGTTAQFQVIGRPGAESGEFYFTPRSMPGASRPKHEEKLCRGLDLRLLNSGELLSDKQINLTWLVERLSGDQSELITSPDFFNKLAGNDQMLNQLTASLSEDEIRESWEPALSDFKSKRKEYLLYSE